LAVHGLQVVAALLGSRISDDIMISESELPRFDVLSDGEFGVAYFDAGSRDEPSGLNAYAVKLAVLARVYSGGDVVSERILYPLPKSASSGEVLPPIFVGFNREARAAASYAIELAAMLATLEDPRRIFKDYDVGKVLVVRHGPLLQVVSQYTARPYRVNVDEAEGLLAYAGLEQGRARELLEYAYECKGNSKNRNRVVLGLLILALIAELAAKTREGFGVAGIVEDVSRAHLLVATAVAKLIERARKQGGGGIDGVRKLALALRDSCVGYYTEGGDGGLLEDCLCPDLDLLDLLDSRREWEELLARVESSLKQRFGKDLWKASREEIEASLLWSGVDLGINDDELVYTLYYMAGGIHPATRPVGHRARLKILEFYLEEKRGEGKELSCYKEEDLKELINRAESLVFEYMAPQRPPSCRELRKRVEELSLNVKPCQLAELILTPPVVRLEYVEGMNLREEARALTLYPSMVTAYGYPSQLLLVDYHSRIGSIDISVLHQLAEKAGDRTKPYASFLRNWRLRVSTTTI